MRWLTFVAVVLWAVAAKAGSFEERPIGVKIYDYDGDYTALFDEWQTLGINSVFASVALNDQPQFREQATDNNIKRFVIVPTFYNPEALEADPSLYAVLEDGAQAEADWLKFVSPSNAAYRRRHLKYIRDLVQRQQPDGLSIDFIRYFSFWEMVPPSAGASGLKKSSYDLESLEAFQKDTGVVIPVRLTSVPEVAEWIDKHHAEAWTVWRIGVITSMVRDIAAVAKAVKPDILINVHLVPWRQSDFGGAVRHVLAQDVAELVKHADMLSPMVYAHMVHQDAGWVKSVVVDVAMRAGQKFVLMPSVQVAKEYREEALSVADFEASLRAALLPPSYGVSVWSWSALDASPEKKAVFKRLVQPVP